MDQNGRSRSVNVSTFLGMGQWRNRRPPHRSPQESQSNPVAGGWLEVLNTTSKSEVVPVFALVPLAVDVYLPLFGFDAIFLFHTSETFKLICANANFNKELSR